MAVINALDRNKHFAEFNDLLQTNSGFLTGEMRKQIARDNLEVPSVDEVPIGGLITDTVNPLMYGAVGDGLHDDTAALQAMIASGHKIVDWLTDDFTWTTFDTLKVTIPYTIWYGTATIKMIRTDYNRPLYVFYQSSHHSHIGDGLTFDHNASSLTGASRANDLALALYACAIVMSDYTYAAGSYLNGFDNGLEFASYDFTGDGSVGNPYNVTAQYNAAPVACRGGLIYGFNCGSGDHVTGAGTFKQGGACDILTSSSTLIEAVYADECYAGLICDFASQASGSVGTLITRGTKQDSRLPGGSGMGIYNGGLLSIGTWYSSNDAGKACVCYNTSWALTIGSGFVFASGEEGVWLGGSGWFSGRMNIGEAGLLTPSPAFTVATAGTENVRLDTDILAWGTHHTFGYYGNDSGAAQIHGKVNLYSEGHTSAPFFTNGNELVTYTSTNGDESHYSETGSRLALGKTANATSLALLQVVGEGVDFEGTLPISQSYNLYWDGTNWRHSNAQAGLITRFDASDVSWTMYYAPAGTADAIVAPVQIARFSATGDSLATPLPITSGGTDANTAAGARTNLGLGTMATQNASAVAITGGSVVGITDLAIADGGTGASTASGARTNLGVAGGQLPATATNDNATAGNLSEYIQSEILVGSAVSLTTATTANVTSISLTAGDWDVKGIVAFAPAGTTTVTSLEGAIHTVSATLPTIPNGGAYAVNNASLTTGATEVMPVGVKRISLASTTTVYLVVQAAFGTSTMAAYGGIYARRVR